MNDQQAPRSNRKLIVILAVAALFLCIGTAIAGFAIGRATATPTPFLVEADSTETALPVTETAVVVSGSESGDENETAVAESSEESSNEESRSTNSNEDEPTAEEPAQVEPRQEDVADIDFSIFYEAWKLVQDQYDGDLPSNEDILYAAIAGSIDEVGDDYTRFIEPDVAARLREDAGGAVEGIGAFVRENDEGLFEIVRPIPGQPADLVGLLPGDIVLSVDGESVLDISFDEVILKVRGPRGTEVTLTIQREGEPEPLEFIITRVRFEVPTVEYEMLDDNIAYVKLTEFNRTASEKLNEALTELLAEDPQAVIFDLRDNPGGFLDQSVMVADTFLAEGTVLFERNREGLDQIFTSDNGDMAEDIPLVVLVNGGSASASEIVAGAIQDNSRGILIGEQTFGKGSVQQVHTLSDGSEIRVTIARWYTPDDNSIDKEGITPDIEVPMEFDSEEDIQLQRAVEYVLTGE